MLLRGESRFSVLDLSHARWEDFPALIQRLSPDDAIIVLSLYRDMDGTTLSFDEGLAELVKNAQSPIYHCWQHGIGDGILGGKVISFEEQGRKAAGLAMEIIRGADPSALPLIPGSDANVLILDGAVMDRFGIEASLLPDDSIILNDTPSFWEQNKMLLVELGAIICALLVIILFLIKGGRARAATEKLIRKSEKRYRTYIEGAPDGLLVFDALGSIVQANGAMAEMCGYSPQEMEGMSVLSLLADEDKESGRKGLEALLNDAKHNGEYQLVRKDGSLIHMSFHGVVLELSLIHI